MKLLSRSEQPQAGGGRERGIQRRASHSDSRGKGSTAAATVTDDPAELVNIINTLAKKTQKSTGLQIDNELSVYNSCAYAYCAVGVVHYIVGNSWCA